MWSFYVLKVQVVKHLGSKQKYMVLDNHLSPCKSYVSELMRGETMENNQLYILINNYGKTITLDKT